MSAEGIGIDIDLILALESTHRCNFGDATGGEAGVYAMFGTIAVDGSVQLSADAIGGDATVGFGGNGGNALGGTAYVQADGSEEEGARLTIAGDATMLASGRGGVGG